MINAASPERWFEISEKFVVSESVKKSFTITSPITPLY
jgi:hypothetical protein